MSMQFKAIYENGVFRPLQSVQLAEKLEVTLTIDAHGVESLGDHVLFSLTPDRWQSFCEALDAPPKEIPALRKLLTEASLFDGANSSAKSGSA